MREIKCPRCGGELREQSKTITAVESSKNYEMFKAETLKCVECGHKVYLKVDEVDL